PGVAEPAADFRWFGFHLAASASSASSRVDTSSLEATNYPRGPTPAARHYAAASHARPAFGGTAPFSGERFSCHGRDQGCAFARPLDRGESDHFRIDSSAKAGAPIKT